MTDPQNAADDTLARRRELRTAQLALVWPAAERAAATADHEPLVDLIKVYTAVPAIDSPWHAHRLTSAAVILVTNDGGLEG